MPIFDFSHVRAVQKRFLRSSNRPHLLHELAVRSLQERLETLKFPPQKVLWQRLDTEKATFSPLESAFEGCLDPCFACFKAFCESVSPPKAADSRAPPFTLYVNFFTLHRVNDIVRTLRETHAQMAAGDLFLAVFPGGESLHELRQSLIEAETALRGGIAARTMPMITLSAASQFMQEAGFTDPVADREKGTFLYPHLSALLRDLRRLGETNVLAARPRTPPPRKLFAVAEQIYASQFKDDDSFLQATFELIYLHGTKR